MGTVPARSVQRKEGQGAIGQEDRPGVDWSHGGSRGREVKSSRALDVYPRIVTVQSPRGLRVLGGGEGVATTPRFGSSTRIVSPGPYGTLRVDHRRTSSFDLGGGYGSPPTGLPASPLVRQCSPVHYVSHHRTGVGRTPPSKPWA